MQGDEITRLIAEVERLREALEPFAADKLPTSQRIELGYDNNGLRRVISPLEVARMRARAALSTPSKED